MFKWNVDLAPPLKLSPWRKIAMGSWRNAKDPSVYGTMDIDVTACLSHIEELNKNPEGIKVTITHLVGKAIANCFARHPDINCVLRLGRLYPRKNVDVFFQVATDTKGVDLSGVTVRQADKKTILEIASEMQGKVTRIRKEGDLEFKKTKGTMKFIPGFLVACVLDLVGFIMYGLNIWSPILGTPRDGFGSVMVTNVGSLGLGLSFAPLLSYSRVPILFALSAIEDKPVVKDGMIVIAPVIQIGVTIDHRVVDGVHGGHMARSLRNFFANPNSL
jgi:pyruvate/2-oxoglutarate dehydrogenase complex dihydrolipoamide acyltransferase (E2) component